MKDKTLRELGLKVTLPRLTILKLLEEANTHHMSADDVYRQLLEQGEDIGLATVYRVLTQFEAAGLIKRHHFSNDHSVFELEQGVHHDHLVCLECKKVVEFVDGDIERRQIEIAKKNGFEITDHTLTIYGVCQGCATVRGAR